MMHAMHEYRANNKLLQMGSTYLLAYWDKKKEKTPQMEKRKEKKVRAFARPCVELSPSMLSNNTPYSMV